MTVELMSPQIHLVSICLLVSIVVSGQTGMNSLQLKEGVYEYERMVFPDGKTELKSRVLMIRNNASKISASYRVSYATGAGTAGETYLLHLKRDRNSNSYRAGNKNIRLGVTVIDTGTIDVEIFKGWIDEHPIHLRKRRIKLLPEKIRLVFAGELPEEDGKN